MKKLDINLNYFLNDERMCKFIVPKSYESTTLSLLCENDIIEEVTYGPSDFDFSAWFLHPFLDKFPNKEFKVVKNLFAHNGEEETELFFIHINKCGGSSIETVAYEYGVRWGRWVKPKIRYHEPSEYFMNLDIVKDKVLFTSIRNPYERLISGVYCPYGRIKFRYIDQEIDIKKFNEILRYNINDYHTYYDYIYHKDKKVIPHVLKLENLNNEFNQLMSDYNCEIRMDKKKNLSGKFYSDIKYGVEHISKENLKLINEKFKKDFHYFNYDMIKR